LEDCMTKLKGINPQSFRLGSGREEPDGSFSFLVRFTGREEGITGELFVRFEERRPKAATPPPVKEAEVKTPDAQSTDAQPADAQPSDAQSADIQSVDIQPAGSETEGPPPEAPKSAEIESGNEKNIPVQAEKPVQATPVSVSSVPKIWFFEDLILEEPRSREEENRENRHRFDFSPYERFY